MIKRIFKEIDRKSITLLTFGTLILAIGINLFIAPHCLAFGGITGMTIILQSLAGLPLYASNIILSMAVILLGRLELGHKFMVKTIIPTMTLPLFLLLTQSLSKVTPNLPISAILGAITVGIGISMTMHAGGSTAGPDTIGLVMKKRFHIPVALSMLTIDILIILCGCHIYGAKTAAWSTTVAILMNLTVKFGRDLLSGKTAFSHWDKFISHKAITQKYIYTKNKDFSR